MVDIFEGIKDTIRGIFNKVIGIVNGAIGTVNSAIGGIESAFSFGPWEVPTPFGKKTIGFSAAFPRVPTIPYLAKGAVIPPRSEFMAVLGDQKSGTNIETPEKLLRQIFREEFGSVRQNQNTGNNVYKVSVEVSGRKLLDFVIDEGELRQKRNGGKNPFALGGT